MQKELELTGERLIPTMKGEIIFHHLHRYALAYKLSEGMVVLDIASGEGYGSNLLAGNAQHVIGVDISEDAIRFSKAKYQKQNLEFRVGSASLIPVEDQSIDLVISFETIEHHDLHEEMMLEFKRVLKPEGIVLISSPDKLNYTDIPNYRNPYHVKELYSEEFEDLMQKHFKNCQFFNQNMLYGSMIIAKDEKEKKFRSFQGDFQAIQESEFLLSLYNLCLASDSTIQSGKFAEMSFFNAQSAIEHLQQLPIEILNSKTYKVGLAVTFPIRLIRKLFKTKG